MDRQRSLLIVEDDEATRGFLADNLRADGFRVATASGAGEGLRAIEVRQPSLVVLDPALEDGSGLDLLDRVRSADGLATRIDPDLPVIVLTGRAGEADRVRSFVRGADDHVCKPTCHFLPRLRAQFEVPASSIGERRSSGAADPAQDRCPSRGAGASRCASASREGAGPWSALAETAASPQKQLCAGPGSRTHQTPAGRPTQQ